jgi:hypothetical protein
MSCLSVSRYLAVPVLLAGTALLGAAEPAAASLKKLDADAARHFLAPFSHQNFTAFAPALHGVPRHCPAHSARPRGARTGVTAPPRLPPPPPLLKLRPDDKQVREAVEAYIRYVQARALRHKDLVAFASSLHGKMPAADVYRASRLFVQLWPRLLQVSSVEALVELQKHGTVLKIDRPTMDAVHVILSKPSRINKRELHFDRQFRPMVSPSDTAGT